MVAVRFPSTADRYIHQGHHGYIDRVTKRLVDIDDELLAQATKILGASTMKEAVNRSLEEIVRVDLRRRHADRLTAMDGLDLDDDGVMSRAWR